MKRTLLEAIKERVLVGDGAMGTQLQQAGLEPGGCGEAWNLSHPDRVRDIQARYVDAGSDCLISNTFGGCRIMLERYDCADRVSEINQAAVQIARDAFGSRDGYVLGDIGPFGGLMEPYGDIPENAVVEAFEEQAEALVSAGADAIIVETQTSLEELGVGIDAARKAGATCIIGSMAFDVTHDGADVVTMMGIRPEDAAAFMKQAGVDVVALNCGTGIDVRWASKVVPRYRSVCDLPAMAQPNAGTPVLEKMKVVYRQTPEEMVEELPALLGSGVNIVGACCGSTAEHIRKIRDLVDR